MGIEWGMGCVWGFLLGCGVGGVEVIGRVCCFGSVWEMLFFIYFIFCFNICECFEIKIVCFYEDG